MPSRTRQALSAIDQVSADQESGQAGRTELVVLMPPGLLNRAARYLQVASALVDKGVLPADFSESDADQILGTYKAGRSQPAVLRPGAGLKQLRHPCSTLIGRAAGLVPRPSQLPTFPGRSSPADCCGKGPGHR